MSPFGIIIATAVFYTTFVYYFTAKRVSIAIEILHPSLNLLDAYISITWINSSKSLKYFPKNYLSDAF